jgi:peroxiredoxin
LARKADYKRFEALGVQNLAVSANATFSQQTFAESLKLPYPLLSDSRPEGHPQLRRPQREDDDREQVVLSDRSTGSDPQEVDDREPDDDGRV